MENESKARNLQKSMLFYTVGALIYYFCQWSLSVAIVWISGYEAAGVLSIALTVCAAPAIVSLFNVRAFQVSDLKGEYNTRTYTNSRHVTNILSYLVCICMVLAGGYNLEKALVILVFMLYKVAEGTADVYYGIEQKHNRLDLAGISYTLRGIGTIAPFVIAQILWNNLLLSLLIIMVCSFAVIWFFDIPKCKRMEAELKQAFTFEAAEVKKLLVTCIPLAVVAFLNNLSINLPKITLEDYFGSEVMGYFSSVASPSMAVQLAAITLFTPLVTPLAEAFMQKNRAAFFRIMKQFLLLLAAFALVCILGSVLLGKFALILLFGPEIEPYTFLLLPSFLMTILVAMCFCLYNVCTLVREIKKQYLIGVAGIISSAILAFTVVKQFSMMGVIYAQIGTILLQIVVQVIIIWRKLKKIW